MNNSPIRVLLADNHEVDFIITRNLLADIKRERFELEWVAMYDVALTALEKGSYDVCLLDYRLGNHRGLELLSEAIRNGCKAPIILLTGEGDYDVDVEAMKAGAADFLVKSQIDAPLLERSIRYAIRRKRLENQLRNAAFHDVLTGLPNRALFLNRLGHVFERSKRQTQRLFAVLFLDLDHFKVINDSLGHVIGDQLLIVMAHRLQALLRSGDTVARLGGDEFAILLDDVKGTRDVIRVTERIQKELALPLNLNGHEASTTVSIGIGLSIAGHDLPEEILRDADTAMYYAKKQGRARYELFDAAMCMSVPEVLTIEDQVAANG